MLACCHEQAVDADALQNSSAHIHVLAQVSEHLYCQVLIGHICTACNAVHYDVMELYIYQLSIAATCVELPQRLYGWFVREVFDHICTFPYVAVSHAICRALCRSICRQRLQPWECQLYGPLLCCLRNPWMRLLLSLGFQQGPSLARNDQLQR